MPKIIFTLEQFPNRILYCRSFDQSQQLAAIAFFAAILLMIFLLGLIWGAKATKPSTQALLLAFGAMQCICIALWYLAREQGKQHLESEANDFGDHYADLREVVYEGGKVRDTSATVQAMIRAVQFLAGAITQDNLAQYTRVPEVLIVSSLLTVLIDPQHPLTELEALQAVCHHGKLTCGIQPGLGIGMDFSDSRFNLRPWRK